MKQFAESVYRFDSRNDQNLKISHNSPAVILDQYVSRSRAKRHLGGLTPRLATPLDLSIENDEDAIANYRNFRLKMIGPHRINRPVVIARSATERLNGSYHELVERLAGDVVIQETGTGSHPLSSHHGGPVSRDVDSS